MLVCPACRGPNPEGATLCEDCGAELKASTALRRRRTAPLDVDIPPRKQAARWVPITTFAAIVAGAAALAPRVAILPPAGAGADSSPQISHPLALPRGRTTPPPPHASLPG